MLNTKHNNAIIYAGLFCAALFVCLISCLNPFGLTNINNDTSVFLTIAQGITRGQVPFRDFYDNKGPLTYLISAPGFALGRFTGVWITELLFMCVSVFFAYKTALFFGSPVFAFTGVVLSFIILHNFFEVAAGSEEYALPFMMVSLYIFTKHYFSSKRIAFFELIILGCCFAASVFLRINFFPLWLGFCAVIGVETIHKRDFTSLGKYLLGFLTGICIVTIPVMGYLILNNALSDYINQNIITGSARGFSGFNMVRFIRSFFIITSKNFCFAPLLAGFVWLVKDRDTKKRGYYMGYAAAFILTVLFHAVIRTNFDHYNMVLAPFLVPAFTCFAVHIYTYFSTNKYRSVCCAVFFALLFSMPIAQWFYDVYVSLHDTTRTDLIHTGNIIDEHTSAGDTIIFLGFPARIYLFTQRDTASRYIYQGSGVDYEPGAREEFLSDVRTKQPAVIAIENKEGRFDHLPEWYAPVYRMIENEYRLLSDANGYFLFRKKD